MEGCSLRAAAAESSVSVATAHRWWHRWLDASAEARASGAWLQDRSSRPHRQPRADAERRGADLRGPPGDGLGTAAGRRRDRTVAFDGLEGALAARASRAARRAERGAPNRYEWPCPGDLLHMDVCTLRALSPARAPRDRRPLPARSALDAPRDPRRQRLRARDRRRPLRLAYVELHDDERAATVTAFVERALAFFAGHGITARRLMTDNAFTYVKNRSLRELLAARDIRHLTTQPYRPRTNGKVERFHQTMGREWAHGRSYPTSAHRASLLGDWLEHYNHRRPHSASATGHPSAAFTTSEGRTARAPRSPRLARSPARAGSLGRLGRPISRAPRRCDTLGSSQPARIAQR